MYIVEEVPLDESAEYLTDRREHANPEARYLHTEQADMFSQALLTLDTRSQEVLLRSFMAEQPDSEIMTEMNMTDAQLWTFKSRAKAKVARAVTLRMNRHRLGSIAKRIGLVS